MVNRNPVATQQYKDAIKISRPVLYPEEKYVEILPSGLGRELGSYPYGTQPQRDSKGNFISKAEQEANMSKEPVVIIAPVVPVINRVNIPNRTRGGSDGSLIPIPTSTPTQTVVTPPPTEIGIVNQAGALQGVESGYYNQSLATAKYNRRLAESERIQSLLPKPKYFDPDKFKTYETKQVYLQDKSGRDILTTTPNQVYTDPKTGQPISNLAEYLKENKIPIDTQPKAPFTFTTFKEYLNEPQIYDTDYIYSNIRKLESGSAIPYTGAEIGVDVALMFTGIKEAQILYQTAKLSRVGLSFEIPRTFRYFAEGFKGLPTPIKTLSVRALKGVNLYFTGQSIKEALNKDNSLNIRLLNVAFAGLGSVDIAKDVSNIGKRIISRKITSKTVPSLYDTSVLEFARERGTFLPEVIGKDGKSLGILLAKNKQGEFISIGGGIDKGESTFKATLREAFEEAGIKAEQIKGFRQIDRFATPEEVQNVFTGQISEEVAKGLIPKSDVTEFKLFQPSRFEDITGATPRNPRFIETDNFIKRWLGLSNKVRITEATLLSRYNVLKDLDKQLLELNKKEIKQLINTAQTKLTSKFAERIKGYSDIELIRDYKLLQQDKLPKVISIKTKKGELELFLQSRYNVPGSVQERYYKELITKGTYKYSDAKFENEVLELSGYSSKKSEILKISKKTGEIVSNRPQLIVSGTQNPLVLNARGELEIQAGIAKRSKADVLFFQPPVSPSGKGYVGLSYVLGGGETEFKLGLFPDFGKKSILYGKAVIDKELFNMARLLKSQGYSYKEAQRILNVRAKPGTIGATAKSAYGIETEFGATVGTKFELTKEKQFNVIEGQVVETRNIRKITDTSKLNKVNTLYERYFQTNSKNIAKQIEKLTGINPSLTSTSKEVIPVSNIISSINKLFEQENNRILDKSRLSSPIINNKEYLTVEKYTSIEKKVPMREKTSMKESIYNITSKEIIKNVEEQIKSFDKFTHPLKPISPIYPPEKITNIVPTIYSSLSIPDIKSKERSKSGLGTGYNVYGKELKSTKMFKINSSPVTKSRAEDIGAYYVTQTLAKTFIVKKANQQAREDYEFSYIPAGYFKSEEYKLRSFRIRKGKAVDFSDERFIQKTRYGLSTIAEKKQIQSFRKQVAQALR